MVFSKDLFEVKGVAFTNIFDAKIINNKEKHNRTPLVAPETRSEGELVVVMGLVVFIKKLLARAPDWVSP